ncbi:competence type IV pilus assembly protein ComGB [Vagococcus sp. PNs007]|uniref:Competence type IV pilus assembly protein ComGB n=2 Tax=Vagococcus proximus TaxID=2991417 RepID=A0ABT5X0W8_9ENTE|nr:competence type IV pilus assembly protein ComGB [Vagococcus proximus]
MVLYLKQIMTKKRYSKHKKRRQQAAFLKLLDDLLRNGFSIQESLSYIVTIKAESAYLAEQLRLDLAEGISLSSGLAKSKFESQQVMLLYLAETHGDLEGTLSLIHKQVLDRERQLVELKRVLAYPSLLIFFLVGVMLMMKSVILPQLGLNKEVKDLPLGQKMIDNAPTLVISIILLAVVSVLIINYSFKSKSMISKIVFWSKIPLVRQIIQRYYTSFFASELGKLLNQGLELKQIVHLMSEVDEQTLLKEVAIEIGKELEEGHSILFPIRRWCFFRKELVWIIEQGEMKGNLGDELQVYGKQLWEELNDNVLRLFSWIQPIIFILVALLIVLAYGSLLLPIYQEMEGML